MKNLKKILSVLTLIVLVGSDFLTSISYALDDMLEDSVVVQTENEEETETLEIEEKNVDEEGSEAVYEDESMEKEELETENPTGDIVEEGTGEVSEIGSGEVEELTEETVEGVTGDVEELTGEVVESTEIGEETVIEDMTYNEEPITGEKTYNDVTVRVEALTGIFPEGTELKIEPIKGWNLSSLKDKLVEENEEIKEDTTIVAFDITFNYEGEEVQPKDGEKVKVTFDYSKNEELVKADKNENQEVKVYHIEDKDEEGNKVVQGEENVVDVTNKQESVEIGIAVVDADSFSVYVVTYGNEDPEFSATLVGDDSARNNFHYKTITISDGEHTYTLMDRNLGARVAWNTGIYAFGTDNSSNYDTADDYYGYYYQWGNNYGFSAKRTQLNVGEVLSNAIPSNYVSNRWNNPYPSGLGNNLRGNTTNTESARQGPCPRGWHVPSVDEWTAIRDAWCVSADKGDLCIYYGQDFANALQMPTAGYRRFQNGNLRYTNRSCTDLWNDCNGYYWSSTSNDGSKANYFFLRSSGTASNNSPYERVNGFPVRCLKNNTDAITLYLNPNGGRVEDGIKDADAQGKVILPTATRNEYNFDGWYDAVDGGNRRGGSGDEITINEDTDLYAHWSEIIPNPIVIFNNGADITEFEVESGGTLTNEQVQQILNLTHTKATFDGWYKDLEFTQPFDFNTIITEDISLYAKWTCKEGYITLQGNGGPDMNCFEYETISYEYDGNKHVLMDRNLGAQMIGFGREADLKSYGYYYQWGNNYGFGPFTTPITSNTQVDCTNINPSTYSRSTFITGSSDFDWCSPRNDNLWGGNGDGLGNNRGLDAISATVIDRQGPCPRGWHVPSAGERQTLLTYWVSLNGVTRDSGTSYEYRLSNFTRFSDDFKMPLVGRRAYEGAQLGGGGSVYLWSSSPNVDDDLFSLARNFDLSNTDFLPYANSRSYRAYGMPVRCFMNNPKTITFNYNGGEGENFEINVPSGTKVTAPADPTNGDQIFAGWYASIDGGTTLANTAFDFNEEITQDVDLYAKWVSCENGEIYAPESGKCVARWHELVSLTDDNTTTTVGSDEPVDGLPAIMTVTENTISEIDGQKLAGELNIDFGGKDAKFSHLVKVKIPVTGSSKAYVKVKHVGSTEYNFTGLTTIIEASCDDGNIVNTDDMYHGEYMNVESGYVSIYTCEASDFAAFGTPKVTFEPNNGDDPIIVEVESGATVDNGDIPIVSNSGLDFAGWYISEDDGQTLSDTVFDFGTPITGDIMLYAKWQEDEGVTYTVTFDANRGTFANTPAAQTVTDGNYAEEPQTHPELPGYIFTGWWTEPRGGTQWNFANDTVTGNITLYAHWTYKEIFGDLDVYMIDSNGSLIKYVMMDRNLGATGVYNKDFDSQNPNSFGFVYQWGNNYGFPRCNGNATCNYSPITDTPVSVDIVENYIPSKFASSTWIGKNGGNGSSKSWHSNSGNVLKYLWGNGNTIDMQGPCPDGYHVPLTSETNDEGGLFRVWGDIYDKTINTIDGKGKGFSFISDDQKLFSSQFLFPHAGNHKKGNTREQEQNMCGDYWTATPSGLENAINIWFCKDGDNSSYDTLGNFLFTNNSQRNNGSTLRCFKNSTSSANLNIVDGGKKGLITVEKVGGVATINAIKVPENTDASGTDLIFDGWYTSPTFESNTMKTGGDTLSDSVTALYAKWNCPDGSPYNSNNQCALGILVRFMDGETEYTRSIVLSGEEVSAPATNPEKSGYNFLGWFESGANSPFVFTGTPITGDLDLYAHWDINNYDVNVSVATGDEDKGYLSGMGSTGISLTGLYDYGTELVFIAIPELGYVFDYWMNGDQVLSGTDLGDGKNQLTVTVDQVLDIIAFFKETLTPYTVEHYQQNLSQTGYDFVWSGIMYGIANEQTNATGTNYTGFTLSGNLADYQTGINADGSTVVRLYYNRVSVVSYLVSFNADRGTFVSGSISQSVASGTLVTPLTEEQKPVFPGYRVDGWYKTNPRLDSNAEEWIFDQDVVTGDITLYAHWTNNYDVRDLDIYFVVDDSTGSYYTTLDRDVGASQLGVAGYQYQWGNNHGFKACTTSKCNSFPGGETTSTNQVDVSDYDPISNPYSSNIYIIQAGNSNKESNWAIGNVNRRDNLWGGVSGTNAAMQGPCPEGYHIPTSGDWEDIYASWSDINFGRDGCKNGSLKTCATKLVEDLLLTPHGRRDHEAKVDFLTAASYWSSSPNNGASKAYGVYINSNESTDSKAVQVPNLDGRIRARAVRCVKNEYNTPLIIKINGGTGASLSVYSGSLHYLTNPTKEGYEFSGWYSNLTGNVKIEDGSTLPQGTITLYAKWISNNEAEYIFNASGGIFNSTSTEELVHVYTLNDEINSGDIETPIRTGYNFLGWYDESGEPVSFPIVVTGNLNLYAHWEESGQTEATITVNHHWMNIGGSGYTLHETEYFSGNIGDEFTAIEKVYTGFTAKLNNDDTIIISGDNNSNVIDLYYDRHRGYFHFLIDPFNSAAITVSGCDNGTCWYGEDVQLTVQEETGYIFNSWGTPTSITLPEGLDRTQKTLSFTMPEINDMQIRWSVFLTAIPYTITYHLNGGEEVEHNQTEYTAGNFVIYVTDPVKTGYDFLGWTGGVIDGPQLSSPTTGLLIVVNDMGNVEVGDREYYANWTPNKYEVTGSVAEGQENMGYLSGSTSTGISLTGLYDYATELVFIAIPELGYVFDYWKNGDTVLSGTDLGDGKNQITIVVDQILDIIAFFKPADDTPYTVEHYKQNLGQTGYEFAWSGTMYGTTNGSTNATGTDYEGFALSGDLANYQTGIKADGTTIVRLYYNRNTYTVTWDMWEGYPLWIVRKFDVIYGSHPVFEWDDVDQYTPKRGRDPRTDDIKYDFTFTGWVKSGSSEIIKDLTTQIVTGDVRYIAQYDTGYRYYEVRYYTDEGTGTMEPQSLQLYSSGTLNKNKFIRTGYIFSGWWYEYGDGIEVFYEDEQEINLGVEDDVIKSDAEWEDPLYLDVYAQWKPSTGTKVTVNYYLKDLDAENNVLINSKTEYATGVEFIGNTDDVVDILSRYGTGIEGYDYSKSIVYGSDFPGGVETGITTILADGSRVIDMYYVPSIYQFILNSATNSSTAGSSESTGYYYGANVRLSGDSNDDCFTWSGWMTSGITLSDVTLYQTGFAMPANDVEVAPSTTENTYNIIFNGNGSNSGTMSPMNGIRCTESTGLAINTFEKSGHTFTGWSTTQGGIREYADRATINRLSTGADVNLYAVWDINKFEISANVATGDHGSLQWSGSGIYDFGETLAIIAVPELGYLFDYWEINGETELPEGATTGENQLTIVVNQILDIVAHFTENAKTVTVNYYEMDTGGTYSGVTNSTTFTGLVGYTGYANIDVPYGFHLDTERTANIGIVISDNDAENVISIYYARNKHHITLGYAVAFLNSGSVTVVPTPRESGYYYGEDVHFEAIVSTGYVFKQWRKNGISVGDMDGADFVMGDEDVELVVDGDLINYNIDYYTEPGYSDPLNPNPDSYTILSGDIEIHNPIAEFCNSFLGWTGGTTGDRILSPTTGLVIDASKGGDRKYYASWEWKSYEVALSVDPSSGGTVTGAGTYRCMGEIELHATSNTGYHFVGWYDTGGNLVSSNSMYFFRAPVGSLGTGLIAKFERNQYYVTIDKNGSGHFWGESAPSGRYYHGTPITFFASPSYGYKIQKWSKNRQNITTGENDQLYTGFILDVIVTETGNYEVYFEPETYNIIYMDSGSILTGLSPATYTIENHVYSGDLPSITKDGYNFAGWFYEYPRQPENQIQEIGYVPVDGQSVTILAGWMPIDYNINYHLLTGVEIIPWEEYYPYEFYQSYNIETERTNLPEPQKSGYVFSGWVDYHGKSFTGFGGGMTGDLDLYPTWRSDVMDITVNYYEMNTGGEYYPSSWAYYETYHYTGFTNSEFIAPDYTTTGFHLDWNKHPNGNPSIVISGDENVNIIDVYYEREKYYLERVGLESCIDNDCITFATVTPDTGSIYYGEEIRADIQYNEGWSFSGWYNDDYNNMQLPDEVDDLTSEHIVFHMPARNVKIYPIMDHILYKLTFTGYEGAEVMNYDSTYVSLTGENYYRFDSEIELPYLNKPGYNFIGWNSGDYNIWSIYYSSNPNHPIRHMPSHDVELTAVFEPKTNMEYNEYYYLQDVEGTGYTRDDELTQRKYDGTTEQQIPYPYPQKYITGFEYTGFGYDGVAMRPWEEWPTIKATGDNYINYYYDRKVDGVYVEYDNKKMFITGTGEYRYGAPVNLIAVVKTGYEFSGFTSYQGELLSSGSVYNFTMPDSYVYLYADANPIVYSIDYEMNGGYFVPYNWAKTGYTVDGDFDLDIFDAGKEGYTFLGWTGGVIGVRELTEPTTGLIIPLGSTGNRKYFANFEATGSNVTVNYYLKKIDPENNVLTGEVDEYISKGVVYTGLTDSVVDIHTLYGTGIEGYEYTTAIVYGSDSMDGIETGTTTILGDGTRSIDIYYTPKKYNFTVIQGQNTTTAGTSISTGYYFGAYVTLSGDSAEACFGWDKWGSSDLPEGKNQQHTTFEMPAHNVTVESMVSEKSYNIVFDANGGTGTMSTLSVQCTTGTLSPNNFERNGYTFTGWSRNSGGPVEFTGGSNIHRLSTTSGGEVTLFAIWDFNEYTVTGTVAEGQENMGYLSGSTATGSSLTGLYDYGTELIFIAVPELGYLFDYWEVNGGTGDNLPDGVSISGNQLKVVVDQILDIVAHFTENAKTVTVNYYEMNTGGVYPGVTNSTTFTGLVGHTGYASVNIPYGFHLDTTRTTSTGIVISNNDSENVINIYYARNQHQFNKFYTGDFQYNYNLVDFNPVLKQYYYYGEHIYTNVIAHTGYSVNNLTCSGGDNINIHGTEIEFDMGDKDATIIIDGNKNRYRIDYYLDGGIENPADPNNITGYTINDGFIQIYDPIKTGYNFLGWTGGMSGDWISTPKSGLIIDVENGLGDRQYYANWTGMEYIVTLYVEPETGGTVYGSGVYHYGDLISVWAMTNEGYDFTGWYTYEGYNKISDYYQIGLQADDSGGTGLIAKFELRNHYLEVIPNDWTKGSYYPEYKDYYQYGTIVPVSANPNPGYQIRGWKWNPSEDYITTGEDNHIYTGLNIDVNITWDTSIYVDFEPETYNITYMYSGEILSGDIFIPSTYTVEQNICGEYIPDGSCMYYLPIYSKDGYDFTGWYYDEGTYSYSKVGLLTGMGDITLYAGLIPTTYRVYYNLGSGETLPERYIDNYDEYTIESGRTYLPEPEKQGYDFLGWKDNNNQIITGFGGGMTGNLDLYPVWTGKEMNIEVRYYEMDINGNYNYYTHYDYTGITNSVFNVPDYTTTGFILDGTMHPSGNPSIVVSGNNDANIIDVYYEREEYEITTGVSEHGSVSGETGSQRYGKVITFIAHPEIGYILDKWFKNGEEIEGETGNELTQTVEEGMEISGHFIAATGTEYKVEYYYQNTEDGSYPLSATSGEIRKGTTDTIAEVMTGDKNPTMSGYSFDSENEKNVLSGNINGSGDLVLKIYFKKQFIVKYLTGSKGLFDIEIYEGLDYNGDTPEFGGNTGDCMPGYIFNGWLPEIKTKVTGDVQYVAQWIANTGTEYRVEYYKQNLGGTGYEVWTGIQYGTSDTQGIAEEKYYTGFTYNSGNQNNITSGVIAGDGSLVLKLFYDRNKYTITWEDGNNETLKTEQIFYGAIPVYSGAIPTKTATAQYTYTFNDTWSPNIEPVTTGATYSAQFDTTVNKYLITFKDGDGNVIQSGMVAYGDTPIYTGATPTKTATAQYSYTFNNTRSPSIEFVTTGVSYIAQFDSSVNSYSVNIVSSNTDMGTISTGKINVEYGSNIVESGNKITIGGVEIVATPNLADVQYTYEFDNRTNTCGLELVGTCTIQANFKKTLNKYTITWKDDNGNVIGTTMVEYGIIPTHAKPTKAETEDYRYVFAGWNPEVVAVVGDAEYTATFTAEKKEQSSNGGGMSGGGGGRGGNIDNSQYGPVEEKPDLFTGGNDINSGNVDEETLSLYEWARQNNITTMNTLEEANPDGLLTRGHMAKMVVNFAQNVLGRTIPTTYPDKCNWKDKESDRESPEIKEYAKKACALGLMGIYVKEFMPNKILDRAEFGTVISRLLWGNKYNVTDTYHRSYYEDHLRLLKKNGILTQINEAEDRWEIRKWVWLVFRRIEEKLKNKGE